MKTVALIPCYNVKKFCKKAIEESIQHVNYLIVIDDGSTDKTGKILEDLAEAHPRKIHLITFKANRGKGVALLEGFKYALAALDFEALVTLDSDGQHSPSLIPRFVEEIHKGVDLVMGERQFRHMPFRSRLGNHIISWLLRIKCPKAPLDTQSGMRGFSRKFLKEIVAIIPEGRYETEFRCLLLALCQRRPIVSVAIPTVYLDSNRSSHFSVSRDVFLIFKVFWDHLIYGCKGYTER